VLDTLAQGLGEKVPQPEPVMDTEGVTVSEAVLGAEAEMGAEGEREGESPCEPDRWGEGEPDALSRTFVGEPDPELERDREALSEPV